VELRADGSPGLRNDSVWTVLVADYLVREQVDQLFYWPDLTSNLTPDPFPSGKGNRR
jgi:hypothetical protein